MDNKVYLKLESSDDKNVKNYLRPTGIYVGYSKKHDTVFLTVVENYPIDSWGADWEQFQECAVLEGDEVNRLIEILQNIKKIS